MNYKRIYEALIESRMKLKEQRIMERKERTHYYEVHHVLPKYEGGDDSERNLVLLTFKEHFMAHLLLFKSERQNRGDFVHLAYATLRLMASFGDGSSRFKNAGKSYEFYKEKYWQKYSPELHHMFGKTHSDDAKQRISVARKGTMPVKDRETHQMIGSVSVTHPNVLSGKWIHHSSGRVFSENERQKHRLKNAGSGNPNFKSNVTKEYLLELLFHNLHRCTFDNFLHLAYFSEIAKTSVKNDFGKTINGRCMIVNRFGSIFDFVSEFNSKFNESISFDKYYRGFPAYKNQPKYYWFSCDQLKKSMKAKNESDLDKNYTWYRGKKYA